eukprot:259729_1
MLSGGFISKTLRCTLGKSTKRLNSTALRKEKNILYISPIGTHVVDEVTAMELERIADDDTNFSVCSLVQNAGLPLTIESYCYETLIGPYLLRTVEWARLNNYDGVVIGCFYDCHLTECREISDKMIITAPCQSSCSLSLSFGNTFSILVGQSKWIPKMKQNVVKYGYDSHLASFRPLNMGVHDFLKDKNYTKQVLLQVAKICVEKDNCESIILGCTAEIGQFENIQSELNIPVIDSVCASFKECERLIDLRNKFGWTHSRIGSMKSPPDNEIQQWQLFGDVQGKDYPIGNIIHKKELKLL